MGCPACGHVNADNARFCARCGASLDPTCAACSAELRPEARFCDQCGTPVGGAPPVPAPAAPAGPTLVAQRKTITVVFGDVGGSTGLGERLDPEAAREVMNRYHLDVLEVIGEFGGTVDKFNGDGFMATFGIPEVAEDDAARAVAAAVEIQERFDPFAESVHERHGGDPITLRIGVNTGEIVIAEGDPDIIGDALNVAARLERACPSGAVLVGPETWRLTRGGWSYEPQGEVTVAGRVEPVEVFLVEGALEADAETSSEAAGPFVGRDRELGVLRTALDEATTSKALRLVTVVGSPGLGKSRLAREAVAALHAEHSVTVMCERAGTTAFAPVAELIRTIVGVVPGAGADETATDGVRQAVEERLSPADDAGRIADALAGVVGAGAIRSTEETFWAVRRLLETIGREGPTVLVVDDIQWAEPVVLDLLEHLTEWVTDASVLIVCLARPEIRDLRPSLAEPGRRAAHVVSLEGLDAEATAQLASRMLGAGDLPPELIQRLPASTEGNPLFVRELVRMLVDDEVVRRTDHGWELTIDAEAVEVPPTIQSLLAARIDRLHPDERLVLERASVIGPEFAEGALAALLDDGGAHRVDLGAVLERLRRMELVEATGSYWGDEPLHRFHHVLIRDTAYRRLLKGTRSDLHEHVARWTDAMATSFGASAGDGDEPIAFHEEQAHRYRRELGPLDEHAVALGRRAAARLAAAADRSMARDDLTAAGTLASRALDCLADDADERAELLLIACEAHLGVGDIDTGETLVDELDALATDDRFRAWSACFRAQLTSMTDPERLLEAEQLATAAAGMLEALRDDAGAAKGHLIRARILALVGRIGEAEAELDLALTAAREADDNRRITAVLGAAPRAALWGPSPVPRAGGRCLDIVRLLRITTRAPAVEATSMRCQALLEALRGRFDTARKMITRSRRKVDELGLRQAMLETDLFAGHIEFLAGDLDAAEEPLRRAHAGLSAMRLGAEAGQAGSLLARIVIEHGDLDEAHDLVGSAETMAGRNLKTATAWRVAKTDLLLARGETERAVDVARAAVEVVASTDLVVDQADAHLALARALRVAGDAAEADTAERQARSLAEAKGASAIVGAVDGFAEPSRPPIAIGHADRAGKPTGDGSDRTGATTWNPLATTIGRSWSASNDAERWSALHRPDFVQEDRRRGLRDETDYSGSRLHPKARYRWTTIAVLGDRAGVVRLHVVLDPGREDSYEVDCLRLSTVDRDGSFDRAELYDVEDLDHALDSLWDHYRRQCAEDGVDALDNVAARAQLAMAARLNLGDVDGAHDRYADDYVRRDRRPAEIDVTKEEQRETLRRIVGEGWSTFPLTLETSGQHRTLGASAWVGPPAGEPGVDPFLVDTLYVITTDPDGRVRESITFASDQLADARAELHRASAVQPALPPWTDPPVLQTWTKFVTVDPATDEFTDLFHPDATFASRRRSLHEEIGLETALERLRDGRRTRTDSRILAVIGEEIGLFSETLARDDGYDESYVRLVVVDDQGRIRRSAVWDPEDVDAAVAAMWAWRDEISAGGGDLIDSTVFRRNIEDSVFMNLGDIDRAWRDFPEHVWENHRAGEQAETMAERRAAMETTIAAGIAQLMVPVEILGDHAWLNRLVYRSPAEPDVAPFTTDLLTSVICAPDGTVERCAVWTVEQLDEALADLRRRAGAGPLGLPAPMETTVARTMEAFGRDGHDVALAARHISEALVHRDHRPGLQSTEDYDTFASVATAPAAGEARIVAILGDRASMVYQTLQLAPDAAPDTGDAPTAFERNDLVVLGVDTDGLIERIDRFEADQVSDALAVLWQRYHEHCVEDGVDPIDTRAARLAVDGGALVNLGYDRPARQRALGLPPGAVPEVEHRRTGWPATQTIEELDRVLADIEGAGWSVLVTPIDAAGDDAVLSAYTYVGGRDSQAYETDVLILEEHRATGGRLVTFDAHDLDAASAELHRPEDAAPDHGQWDPFDSPIGRLRRATDGAGEFLRDLMAPGSVFTDHRPGLQGELNREEWERTGVPNSPEPGRDLAFLGDRASLFAAVIRHVSDDGTTYEWETLNLHCAGRDGLLTTVDVFAVDDLDAALDLLWERYHEHCVEDGVEPLDSPALRASLRNASLFNRDGSLEEFLAPDAVQVDHRPGEVDRDRPAMIAEHKGIAEAGTHLYLRCIDIAGERSALFISTYFVPAEGDGDSFLVSLLSLNRFDDRGRATSFDVFTTKQLDEALAELGGVKPPSWNPHRAPAVGAPRRMRAAVAAGDLDAAVALLHEDFESRDHRSGVGGTVLRGAMFLENIRLQTGSATSAEATLLAARPRVALNRIRLEHDGFENVWIGVGSVSADGRLRTTDAFEVTDVDAAVDCLLERQRERCTEVGDEPVENAASIGMLRAEVRFHLRDLDGVMSLHHPDFEFHDHGNHLVIGVDDARRNYETLIESSASVWSLPIRISGRRALHVAHVEMPNHDGTDTYSFPTCRLITVAPDGRLLRAATYPVERYDEALADFERRTAADPVEPWDFASTTIEAVSARVTDAMNAADHVTHRGCYGDGFIWRDHRRMVDGTFDADGLVATLGPIQHIDRSPVLLGVDRVGVFACTITSQDFTMEFFNVCWCAPAPDGRFVSIDSFEIDEVDAAVDRHHELVVSDAERFGDASGVLPEGAAVAVNAASRANDRSNAYLNLRRFDDAQALHAADVVVEDRRTGLAGTSTSADQLRRNWAAMAGGSLVGLGRTLRVHGDDRALQVMRFAQDDFTVDMLTLTEIDGDGRIVRGLSFDLDRVEDAVAELERPSEPTTSAEPFDLERTTVVRSIRTKRALLTDGKVDEWVDECVADDFVRTDHRPVLRNVLDREGVRRNQEVIGAAAVDRRTLAVVDDHTALLHFHFLSPGGETEVLVVTQVTEDGRALVEDVYDRDQFDDAMATLEHRHLEDCRRRGVPGDWNAAARRTISYFTLGNLGEIDRAVEFLSEDFEIADRRRVLRAEGRAGRAFVRSIFDGVATFHVPARRVAGDRVSLHVAHVERQSWVSDFVMVHELGADHRCRSAVNFELDQYDEAVAWFEERAAAIAEEE